MKIKYKIKKVRSFWKRYEPPSKRKITSSKIDLITNKRQFNLNVTDTKVRRRFFVNQFFRLDFEDMEMQQK